MSSWLKLLTLNDVQRHSNEWMHSWFYGWRTTKRARNTSLGICVNTRARQPEVTPTRLGRAQWAHAKCVQNTTIRHTHIPLQRLHYYYQEHAMQRNGSSAIFDDDDDDDSALKSLLSSFAYARHWHGIQFAAHTHTHTLDIYKYIQVLPNKRSGRERRRYMAMCSDEDVW